MNIALSVTLSRRSFPQAIDLLPPPLSLSLSAQFYGMKSGNGDFCSVSFASCSIPARPPDARSPSSHPSVSQSVVGSPLH